MNVLPDLAAAFWRCDPRRKTRRNIALEREATADIDAGRITYFDDTDSWLASLELANDPQAQADFAAGLDDLKQGRTYSEAEVRAMLLARHAGTAARRAFHLTLAALGFCETCHRHQQWGHR
jgi:hypothetical protein